MIKQFNISTGMGTTFDRDKLNFLTEEQFKEFNLVGSSGRTSNGMKLTREEFLNSLEIGEFKVTKTKYDNGDFSESFLITFVPKDNFTNPNKVPEMLPWVQVDIKNVIEFTKLYMDFRVSERYHDDDENDWRSELAEKVLEALYGPSILEKLQEREN